jgi:hypothetical protein
MVRREGGGMKLKVKRIEALAVPGGLAYALCGEDGEMLPMQRRCIVDTGIESASLTVEFYIDGDQVSLAE